MLVSVSRDHIQLPVGSTITLNDQTWADYEALLTSRRDAAAIKIRFNAQTQQIVIMAPMAGHGNRIDTLVDLVKALLRNQNRDWHSYDPVTLKRFQEAGAEPDACFYIQNWRAVLGKERLDLATDPPPDLAIEMDLTSLTDLAVYQVLAVPEVWIYRQGQLNLYGLTAGGYEKLATSPTFPTVAVKTLLPEYVERAWVAGSSVALREFEQSLQTGD
ncbi:Uma2 family endonuclease [Leptolyngbya sp. PCC 6406]|uniref:Uma2 family endonuclease n=1 Tax=Leptolyngbya sp. PCC 6406 TaxID=1173264 RepID=UPI000480296A|nr:Uma2 family endonuclease [Leptolyngbya sp. PCC 6406]